MNVTDRAHSTVHTRVRAIFRDALELDVDPQVDVIEGGVLDSMGFVKLLTELERSFGVRIQIADLDLENFRTVDRVADFVEASMAEGA